MYYTYYQQPNLSQHLFLHIAIYNRIKRQTAFIPTQARKTSPEQGTLAYPTRASNPRANFFPCA